MSKSRSALGTEHSLSGEKLSLLAIFAHPEDEGFGPAGTLAKYASEGVQVSLVTANRPTTQNNITREVLPLRATHDATRDRLCSCRTSGIRRVCFLDLPAGEMENMDPILIEDQLVRLIREIQPQVIVTFGPDGLSGDVDHKIISRAATAAFHNAGDPTKFAHHFQENLGTHTPQKLYFCVLPSSLVSQWGVDGIMAVPDENVTTRLDVSSFNESMSQIMFCHRHKQLDYVRWLIGERQLQWDTEYYALAETNLSRRHRRENDLFAGLR
ncbi:MAG: PIG-L family deacetylase [Chloroflexi bacterium]|nr:PIG-L family deacetylase [Chloroflexota bacterium]MBI3741681.1 PIG-L family deacetylase [Chloroflexota bacterium]